MADETADTSKRSALKRFIHDLADKVEALVTLRIITAVGSVEYEVENGKVTTSADTKAMVSEIDLVDGDISTLIDETFVTGSYKDLRAFHQDREKEGHAIIEGNIKALKELVGLARSLANELAADETPTGDTT